MALLKKLRATMELITFAENIFLDKIFLSWQNLNNFSNWIATCATLMILIFLFEYRIK